MDVAKTLRKMQDKFKMSNVQFAKRAGISTSTLQSLYNRNSMPTMQTVDRICESFGITPSQFFGDDETDYKLTQEQRELLEYWWKLPVEKRVIYLEIIKLG